MCSVKSRETLWKAVMECYRELFKHSRPRADFDKLVADKATLRSDWFLAYYLPVGQQELFIDRVCKRNGLTKAEKDVVAGEVHRGCSPNSSLESWRDYRKGRFRNRGQ